MASAIWRQDSRARLIVAHEGPVEDGDRPGEHALHRLVGQRLRVAATTRPSSARGAMMSPKRIGGFTQREP